GDGDTRHTAFGEGFTHVIQLERLDDGHDHFHRSVPCRCAGEGYPAKAGGASRCSLIPALFPRYCPYSAFIVRTSCQRAMAKDLSIRGNACPFVHRYVPLPSCWG